MSDQKLETNVKHQIIEHTDDSTGENLGDLGFGNEFLNTTSKA